MDTRPEVATTVEGHAALEAGRKAWEWYGAACHVRMSETFDVGIAGALDLPDRRHVEVFVESVTDDVWSSMNDWVISDEWVLRAVVPRHHLGIAHEALRERGCELQGYWTGSDGLVQFGPIEIA